MVTGSRLGLAKLPIFLSPVEIMLTHYQIPSRFLGSGHIIKAS
jgi:hypothetical protein